MTLLFQNFDNINQFMDTNFWFKLVQGHKFFSGIENIEIQFLFETNKLGKKAGSDIWKQPEIDISIKLIRLNLKDSSLKTRLLCNFINNNTAQTWMT